MNIKTICDYVWVQLSTEGEEILRSFYEPFESVKKIDYRKVHITDEEGYTRFQIWELAQIFQDYLYNGSSICPFASNNRKYTENNNYYTDKNSYTPKPTTSNYGKSVSKNYKKTYASKSLYQKRY